MLSAGCKMTDHDMIIACMIQAIDHADAAGLVDVSKALSRSMARIGPMVRDCDQEQKSEAIVLQFSRRA